MMCGRGGGVELLCVGGENHSFRNDLNLTFGIDILRNGALFLREHYLSIAITLRY